MLKNFQAAKVGVAGRSLGPGTFPYDYVWIVSTVSIFWPVFSKPKNPRFCGERTVK